jgi:hypothetical protein
MGADPSVQNKEEEPAQQEHTTRKQLKNTKIQKNTPSAPERLWQQPNLQGNLLEEADLGTFGNKQPK